MTTDPSVLIEIEDLHTELNDLARQIHDYERVPDTLPDREYILTHEQQEAVLQALEITGCTFIDRIRLIDVVIGSIVVVVEMPLAGAARLMALRRVKHPQLERKGITDVALASGISTLKKSQVDKLVEAVNFELSDLQGGKPSDASPYANLSDTVPLRVTIDPDKIT